MNIVVCVKHVPDAQADRGFNESDNTVDRAGVDGLLSELDEYAVEEALKLAEASGGEVTVVTIGPDQAADAVITAALGPVRGAELNLPTKNGASVTLYQDQNGATVAEKWSLAGLNHAWSGGAAEGSYTDPKGPDASAEMLRFFLAHPRKPG